VLAGTSPASVASSLASGTIAGAYKALQLKLH
jgi:hypothetical protein